MRIKIVSDGTGIGTKVINADTGERLRWIKRISWSISGPDELATATVHFTKVEIEVIGDDGDG